MTAGFGHMSSLLEAIRSTNEEHRAPARGSCRFVLQFGLWLTTLPLPWFTCQVVTIHALGIRALGRVGRFQEQRDGLRICSAWMGWCDETPLKLHDVLGNSFSQATTSRTVSPSGTSIASCGSAAMSLTKCSLNKRFRSSFLCAFGFPL